MISGCVPFADGNTKELDSEMGFFIRYEPHSANGDFRCSSTSHPALATCAPPDRQLKIPAGEIMIYLVIAFSLCVGVLFGFFLAAMLAVGRHGDRVSPSVTRKEISRPEPLIYN